MKAAKILFNTMVLGEATNNISREFAARNPSVTWKDIANVRHKIVHDYADIDFDTIWDILQKDSSAFASLGVFARALL